MIRMKDFRDDDLWSLFEASAAGDLPAVKMLVENRPELVNAQYNYTPAIHFAVREERLDVAQYLIDPRCRQARGSRSGGEVAFGRSGDGARIR